MDKREAILLEAMKLFTEKGYYGLGLSELLQRCGIPKGSFYYYFPEGKIQLLQETLIYSYRRMARGIEEHILTESTALASFEKMADHLAGSVAAKRSMSSLFLSMISIEAVYLDERIHETCKQLYQQWQQLYAQHLIRFGFTQEESMPRAQAIFALIHGSMISSWIKQDPADLVLAKESLKLLIGNR